MTVGIDPKGVFMIVEVGNHVRSFDFHHMRDLDGPRSCYMEGYVSAIVEHPHYGYKCYEIQVSRVVAGGKEINDAACPTTIYPPVNGTKTTMGRTTDGIEVIA